MENDRYVEIWNIVFSQFDCDPLTIDRKDYKELPHKNIDTGMGLEKELLQSSRKVKQTLIQTYSYLSFMQQKN